MIVFFAADDYFTQAKYLVPISVNVLVEWIGKKAAKGDTINAFKIVYPIAVSIDAALPLAVELLPYKSTTFMS